MLINDFTAISYAIPLLDPDNPSQILKIPHCDGSLPPTPREGLALVVGAGTGLGVGFLLKQKEGRCLAFPSEGGHSELSAGTISATLPSLAFRTALLRAAGPSCRFRPGIAVDFIPSFRAGGSERRGRALRNTFCASPRREIQLDAATVSVQSRPDRGNAAGDPQKTALLANDGLLVLITRPRFGLASVFCLRRIYLAGAFTSKHRDLPSGWTEVMRTVERTTLPTSKYLAELPVMLVRDYSVSLLGAANAAVQLGSGANA
jgi:glucokinase